MGSSKNELSIFSIFLLLIIAKVHSEDKWVWTKDNKKNGVENAKISVAKPIVNELELDIPIKVDISSNSRAGKKFFREDADDEDDYDIKRARYEVSEEPDYINGRPVRPRPVAQYRPTPEESINEYVLSSGVNPVRRPSPPPPSPPGSSSIGILTGPVPSWEKPVLHKNGDPTRFERCRCSFSFNCKSPGIHFGSCDQGKQYCCYNDFFAANSGSGGSFGANIDRYDRVPSVLSGPGGPIDDDRPYNRPSLPPLHNHREQIPSSSYHPYGNLDRVGLSDYDRRPHVPLSQKPVLPPYVGLHNDYRSS